MTVLLLLGLVMVIVALVLASMALTGEKHGLDKSLALIEAMTDAPKELVEDLDPPFVTRVLDPVLLRALRLGRRLTGKDAPDRIRHKLDLAGNPQGWNVDRVVGGKVVGAAAGPLIGLAVALMLGMGMSARIGVAVIAGIVGWFGPNLYLYQKGYDRSQKMQRELPDAIDLLTISVEAGLGFDAALQQVAIKTEGPLADEFSRVLREMRIGSGRSGSLRAMAERTNVPELKTFVAAMVQADAFGIPIGQVLRIQSIEIRTKRRQRAEERAQQVPVKITVPLIFFILPTLFIAVMGPAVISIMNEGL